MLGGLPGVATAADTDLYNPQPIVPEGSVWEFPSGKIIDMPVLYWDSAEPALQNRSMRVDPIPSGLTFDATTGHLTGTVSPVTEAVTQDMLVSVGYADQSNDQFYIQTRISPPDPANGTGEAGKYDLEPIMPVAIKEGTAFSDVRVVFSQYGAYPAAGEATVTLEPTLPWLTVDPQTGLARGTAPAVDGEENMHLPVRIRYTYADGTVDEMDSEIMVENVDVAPTTPSSTPPTTPPTTAPSTPPTTPAEPTAPTTPAEPTSPTAPAPTRNQVAPSTTPTVANIASRFTAFDANVAVIPGGAEAIGEITVADTGATVAGGGQLNRVSVKEVRLESPDSLPEGLAVTFTAGASTTGATPQFTVTAAATAAPGTYTIPVILTYGDDTTDTARLVVTVSEPPANTVYNPAYQSPEQVKRHYAAVIPLVSDPALPDGLEYALVEPVPALNGWMVNLNSHNGALTVVPPATGTQPLTVTVRVTYADGTFDDVTWTSPRIAPTMAEQNAPTYAAGSVQVGKSVTVNLTNQSVGGTNPPTGAVPLPQGTSFAVTAEAAVGMENLTVDPTTGTLTVAPYASTLPGKRQIPVQVTYPDRSTEQVMATVTILTAKGGESLQADETIPPVEVQAPAGTTTTKQIVRPDATEKVTYEVAEGSLPEGWTASVDDDGKVTVTPAAGATGSQKITVNATYADGTVNEVPVTVNVGAPPGGNAPANGSSTAEIVVAVVSVLLALGIGGGIFYWGTQLPDGRAMVASLRAQLGM